MCNFLHHSISKLFFLIKSLCLRHSPSGARAALVMCGPEGVELPRQPYTTQPHLRHASGGGDAHLSECHSVWLLPQHFPCCLLAYRQQLPHIRDAHSSLMTELVSNLSCSHCTPHVKCSDNALFATGFIHIIGKGLVLLFGSVDIMLPDEMVHSWSRIMKCTTSVATHIADSHSLPLFRRKARY